MEYKFRICYPGIYDEAEAAAFAEYTETANAINGRGPIDPQKLARGEYPEGTPGIFPPATITRELVEYYNKKYYQDDPLFNDRSYAEKAGFKDVPAIMTIAAYEHMLQFPVPPGARDEFVASNLWRRVTSVEPMYAGDTIYFVVDYLHWKDITPAEGSIYRTVSIRCGGTMVNQYGRIASRMDMKWYENLRRYDGEKPEIRMPFVMVEWQKRPDHYYSDEDWQKARDIWSKEFRRGDEILYWDDVKVGDEPAWTLDGPFDDTPNPTNPWGPGAGGSRSLRLDYMDPEIFKTMVRNPYDGIYRLPKRSMSYPDMPKDLEVSFSTGGGFGEVSFAENDDPTSKPGHRAIFINFFGRDVALRHLQNWMGDHGTLKHIEWGIMSCPSFKAQGYDFPEDPDIPYALADVPEMRDKIPNHGLERDMMLIKSKVIDKYIMDSEGIVKLAWWIETIDGVLYESGQAEIALPRR